MDYSIIIPVYNRPEEVNELLESLTHQSYSSFEVIIVEDGSDKPCKEIVEKYTKQLTIHYYYKQNSGPGLSRNYGAKRSKGNYLIFLDSDCLTFPFYLDTIEKKMRDTKVNLFGGPDCAHKTFSSMQKAISYSMTSFLTTGGIRGNRNSLTKYFPRSFNMGIRKEVFEKVKGFRAMRFGEDIDLSMRVKNQGYKIGYFPQAWVYHKRRTDLKKFYKQVYNSGMARISLWINHPQSLKIIHILPASFSILFLGSLLLSIFYPCLLLVFLLAMVVLFTDAYLKTKELKVALYAILSSFVQLLGYGNGFIMAFLKYFFLKEKGQIAFKNTFYD